MPRLIAVTGWVLIAALAALPILAVFANVHTAPDLAIWVTMPVFLFAGFGSVVWFPVAMVIVVRRFRAGDLPATGEFIQLFILGIAVILFFGIVAGNGFG